MKRIVCVLMLLFLGVGAVLAQAKENSTDSVFLKKKSKEKKANVVAPVLSPAIVFKHPEMYQKLQQDFNMGKISEEQFESEMMRYAIQNMKVSSYGNCFTFKDIFFQFRQGMAMNIQ